MKVFNLNLLTVSTNMLVTQLKFTCSKSTIKALEKGKK